MTNVLESSLLHPLALVRRDKSVLPADRGIYGLFFKTAPGIAPVEGAFLRDGLSLLYIGTAGANLAKNGTLRNRLGQNHLGGNERRSTLCLTLAALLPEIAGPCIARLERGKMKFHTSTAGAARLRDWMDANILACWAAVPRPAEAEAELVKRYRTPLNIKFSDHRFSTILTDLRNRRHAGAAPLVTTVDGASL